MGGEGEGQGEEAVTEPQAPPDCLRCGAKVRPAFPDYPVHSVQPSGATQFTSNGHYGSTVFDPTVSSRRFLVIDVCDPCLRLAIGEGRALMGTRTQTVEYTHEVWDGGGDDD